MVQRSPTLSTHRTANLISVLHMQVWRTFHDEDLHPYHNQWIQHLELVDLAQHVDFCDWITAHPELLGVILVTDEL